MHARECGWLRVHIKYGQHLRVPRAKNEYNIAWGSLQLGWIVDNPSGPLLQYTSAVCGFWLRRTCAGEVSWVKTAGTCGTC